MTSENRPFAGETMTFGFAETVLGTAAVARGERGVTAILIGDDRARLTRDLDAALGGARLEPDMAGLAPELDAVTRLLAAPGADAALTLDLRGSPVELAVWDALRRVPAGTTISYGALARALPLPATAQEVGAACAANRVAVAVPCHRVVKADGAISGYRWGVQRKRRLINLEGVA
jgi:AraC family transcriptional regulator of adaptative response/methylated-DNA-[protein]-cysteine methyltransferase